MSLVELGRAVCSHQPGDENGKVQDAEDSFDDSNASGFSGDGSDAGGAERANRSEAVVDEVEAVGDGVQIGGRVEMECVRVEAGDESVDAGKSEANQKVDAERSENRFGIRLLVREDAAEDDNDDENVESQTQHDADDGQGAGVELEEDYAAQEGGHGEQCGDQQHAATEANRVNGKQDGGRPEKPKEVVAGAVALRVWVKNKACQQKEEEQEEAACGKHLGVFGFQQ